MNNTFNSNQPDFNPGQPTVLTIYAHADDEVLPAAGTLILMSRAGWRIESLFLTNGNLSRSHSVRGAQSPIKGKRQQEAEAASKIIGANNHYYEFEEGNLPKRAVLQTVEEAVRRWQPSLMITHAPQSERYGHGDHEVCSIAVSNVATRKNIPLWYSAPPVFMRGFEPNFFVDISEIIQEKIAAIDSYESEQDKAFMQLDAILVLSRFWARELGQKDGYFEAFEIFRHWVDASFFQGWANSKRSSITKEQNVSDSANQENLKSNVTAR
jgi:LmbE family N-acetylglucosaminyl deacetylase